LKFVITASLIFGTLVTVLAFPLALVFPRFADVILEPGYYLPNAYWGAVHDPLQLLLALVLDIGFWALMCLIAIAVLVSFSGPRK
jgi:hypothetical protein